MCKFSKIDRSQTGVLCKIDCKIGSMYAAVLPEPVLDRAERRELVGVSMLRILKSYLIRLCLQEQAVSPWIGRASGRRSLAVQQLGGAENRDPGC